MLARFGLTALALAAGFRLGLSFWAVAAFLDSPFSVLNSPRPPSALGPFRLPCAASAIAGISLRTPAGSTSSRSPR